MKIFIFTLCVLMLRPAFARENFKIVCEACSYEKSFSTGTSKAEFFRTGLTQEVYFCKQKKEFLTLPSPASEPKDKKLEIVKVKYLKKGQRFTHSSCKGSLIPLERYQAEGTKCPICNKGNIKIIKGAVVD